MPSSDDSAAFAGDPGTGRHQQRRMSRRSMLRGAAGAGAAGIAAAALPGIASGGLPAPGRADGAAAGGAQAEDTSGQIVVHVRDARSGQIDVFRGTSQTSVRDPELAARLVRASRA
jgi:hypothetical protein